MKRQVLVIDARGGPLGDAIRSGTRTRSSTRCACARSATANGDGIGDFRGLTAKLDYLAGPRRHALWLLPFYPSPGRDDGYDIADYTDVHSDVGTLDDFDVLPRRRRTGAGIRVITELVLNHTSDQHPWFQRARRAPAGLARARLLRLERHARALPRGADHLQGLRAVELDLGSGREGVLLAPLLRPSAGPQLREPGGARGDARRRRLLVRRWASTGCASTRSPTSTSARARTARTSRRRTRSSRSCARTSTRSSRTACCSRKRTSGPRTPPPTSATATSAT